jgi:hypothetical protein
MMVQKAVYQSLRAADHHSLLKAKHNLGPCCVAHGLPIKSLLQPEPRRRKSLTSVLDVSEKSIFAIVNNRTDFSNV